MVRALRRRYCQFPIAFLLSSCCVVVACQDFSVFPPTLPFLNVGREQRIYVNCTKITPNWANVTYRLAVLTSSPSVAHVRPARDYASVNTTPPYQVALSATHHTDSFYVEARQAGRAVIRLEYNASVVARLEVAVVRERRTIDGVFLASITAVSLLNSFSLGCLTDVASIRAQFKRPTCLIIVLLIQFALMPLATLGLVKACSLGPEHSFGLLVVACSPGGGLGHILVSLLRVDNTLNIAVTVVSSFLVTGTLPMWIALLGRVVWDGPLPLLWLSMCSAAGTLICCLGWALHTLRPAVAEAILNWLTKPLLLLFTLLLVTIGVYINIYAFDGVEYRLVMACSAPPFLGYTLTTLTIILVAPRDPASKAASCEACAFNCLQALVALRLSLPQPEADLASATSLWTVLLSPAPCFAHGILSRFRRWVEYRCDRRRQQQKHFSIMSSLASVTKVSTLTSSAAMNTDDNVEWKQGEVQIIDQKVTTV